MSQFIPPSFNLPVAWMVDLSFPVLLKQYANIDKIHIDNKQLHELRRLRDDRVLYISNHPSNAEPAVAYYVANRMGSRFRYMASRHVFDWGYGIIGKFIQSLGAFSVLPGSSDRDSVKASRKILAEENGKLVLYPEGEPTSSENDNLMPFQSGFGQLSFWALDDARKRDPKADIIILPGFVKYVIRGTDASIKADLHQSIGRLEDVLNLDPGNRNLLRRFLAVGRVLLERGEKEYDIKVDPKSDFNYRIGRMRHAILDAVAERIGLQAYDPRADAIIKLRHLLSEFEKIEIGAQDKHTPRLNKKELAWAHAECGKAYNFIAIKPEYLVSYPSPERFFEWLFRFDHHVFGKAQQRLRSAHVSFAKPVKLSRHYDQYKQNKRTAVEDLTTQLRGSMQGLLEEAMKLTRPIVRPFDVGDEFQS